MRRRYPVTIWQRIGDANPKRPATYKLVHETHVDCEDGKVASSTAAREFKLSPNQWTGAARTAFIVRVGQGVKL